jgi:probable Rubsico expression protein CbbX
MARCTLELAGLCQVRSLAGVTAMQESQAELVATPPGMPVNPLMIDVSITVAITVGLVVVTVTVIRQTKDSTEMANRRGQEKERMAAAQRGRALRPLRRDRQTGMLPAGATVTFAAERRVAGIDEVFAALDRDLVGLVPVKKKVQEIGALLLVDRARQRFGLEAPRPNLHMCFTGPPGTGKTTVALRMADLLHRLGYLEQGHLVHAMRDDLVGEYIGQTAPKTKRVLGRAMGGVLFIDEAYYLYRDTDSKDYGQEAIDILLQVMENDRDKLVVIIAGYKDRMDTFFTSNPGMSSRFAHHLDFAAYEVDELVAIGERMLEQASYHLSAEAEAAFRDYLIRRMEQPRFANARSVRNELESARLRHAHRLASDLERNWTRDDLMRLEPADIVPPGLALSEHAADLPSASSQA